MLARTTSVLLVLAGALSASYSIGPNRDFWLDSNRRRRGGVTDIQRVKNRVWTYSVPVLGFRTRSRMLVLRTMQCFLMLFGCLW